MITQPQLAPKAGYIEIEENGERKYKRVYTALEKEAAQAATDRDMMIVDLEYRTTLLELGVI